MTGLMSDWEISGNKNPWVCPSDRHLALRAQLKSGWSVHTQQPSQTGKKAEKGLSDAEQEQIRQVIARAAAIDQQEQQRVGKLVERLDNMKRGKVGNGTTQCMLCGAEFGLFGPRSYAAMCMDCQKYVCQKNCGVDTFDSHHDLVFLCKICSEHREMWKKSGAWFYQGMPKYVVPPESERQHRCGNRRMNDDGTQNGARSSGGWVRSPGRRFSDEDSFDEAPAERYSSGNDYQAAGSISGMYRRHRDAPQLGTRSYDRLEPRQTGRIRPTRSGGDDLSSMSGSNRRKLPLPPTESGSSTPRRSMQRSPVPSIKPRWALEHMGRSDSYTERGEEETSSDEEMGMNRKKHRGRSTQTSNNPNRPHIERIPCGRRRRFTDESDTEDPETRSPTPPSSPRGSWVATPPSSHGGEPDQISEDRKHIGPGDTFDSRSVDSGVVQSDNSQSRPDSFQKVSNPTPPSMSTSASYQQNVLQAKQPTSAFSSVSVHSRLNEECDSGSLSNQEADIRSLTEQEQAKIPIEPKVAPPPLLATPPQKITAESKFTSNFHRQLSLQQMNLDGTTKKKQKGGGQMDSSPELVSSPDDDTALPGSSGRRKSDTSLESDRRRCHSFARVVGRFGRSFRNFRSHRNPRSKSTLPRIDSTPESLGTLEYSLLFDEVNQTLAVNIISAKNLRAMDSNGFSDPYVKLHLLPGASKSTKLRTKTIPKTLNPTWEQKLMYYGVTEDDRLRKTLLLTVLDQDTFGADFIGETRFPLKKLSANKERHFNVYLEKQLPIERVQESEIERGKILIGLQYNAQQQHLVVGLIRCSELLGMDTSGYSDPYVKMFLKPETSKKHHVKSKTKKKTCNPEYNEEYALPCPLSELQKKTLEISVYDRDVGKQDDFIGGITLSATVKGEKHRHWMSCLQNPGQKVLKWHKLLPQETKN